MKTTSSSKQSANVTLISQFELKKVNEALKDKSWVKEIKEKLE